MKIAIVEDNEILALELYKRLGEEYKQSVINVFNNADDLLNSKLDYDLLLLDIELPGIDGITVSKKLNTSSIKIIFLTSLKDRVFDAFGPNTLGFLVKSDGLSTNINKIREFISESQKSNQIHFKTEFGSIEIDVNNIIKVSKENRKIYVYTANATIQIYGMTLSTIHKLAALDLVLVNRSCLININKIVKFNNERVFLFNNMNETISRNYLNSFKQDYLRSISKC